MSATAPNFNIMIPIYEGVDLMDVAAPWELFTWLNNFWTEKTVSVTLVAECTDPVTTRDNKLVLTPTASFDEWVKDPGQANLLWVPGGDPNALQAMMKGGPYLDFITQQSENADWVTSVCEGAMLLAAAGLLNGYMATTHWAFIPCFQAFPEIKVAAGNPRFVVDRNRVTGGGISSGLDEALGIIQLIAGTGIAQQVQLQTQYYPAPPVCGAIPVATTCPIPGY